MSERVNPFGDLCDFKPASSKLKIEYHDIADELAANNGFTSRQPTTEAIKSTVLPAPNTSILSTPEKEALPSRRRSTGRSEQINIKTTFSTKKKLMEISVNRDMPLGEILELALAALEESWQKTSEC